MKNPASLYDPYLYQGQRLYGAAAMNARMADFGGADRYTALVGKRAAESVLEDLKRLSKVRQASANDSHPIPKQRKRHRN